MTKRKNLSKEDLEDVSIFEDSHKKSLISNNKISISDITIKVKCLNEKQKDLKKAIEEKDVVIVTGSPGSGKTYLTLLTALHLLKTNPKFNSITLIKSVQTIEGEDIGFLPGSMDEKMEPFMYSFTGNLDKILSPGITKSFKQQGLIKIMPIAYVRGITCDSTVCIIDEIQNIDMHTFRSIITRIGENSKMIFLGDIEQIDRKYKKESCLEKVAELFKNTEFATSINFTSEESVRNPIIPKLLDLLRDENH